MTQEKVSKDAIPGLRTRALESLGTMSLEHEDISALSPEQIQRLVHELRVHQIELEMQNEDLRTTQLQLEQQKDKYLDLYDYAPVGYVTLSDKGLILDANLTAVGLLGVERRSLAMMFLSSFVCKEFSDAFYLYLQQVFESQSKQTCEIKLTKKDGTLFYAQLESVPIQAADGLSSRCRTALWDITERKRIEEALGERELQLKSILYASPVGVVHTRSRVIIWANHAWEEIFGFGNEQEYIGQPTSLMHLSEVEYEHVRRMLYDNVKQGEVSEIDVILRKKDGSAFDAHIRTSLLPEFSKRWWSRSSTY